MVEVARSGGTGLWEASSADAARGLVVPARVLETSILSSVPIGDKRVKVTIGPDLGCHLDGIARVLERDNQRKQEFLEQVCQDLFAVCQRSPHPSVTSPVTEEQGLRLSLLGELLPEARGLAEFVTSGRGAEDFIREDRAHLHGMVWRVWGELEPHRQEILRGQGLDPRNAFVSPSE